MKKIILGLLMIFSITLFGCDSANLDVGVREDGTIFFIDSTITPDIYLINDDENILIEDEYLFGKLKETIEDKTVVMHDNCDCQPVYSIKIKDYSFSLHNHGILIKKSISKNVKHIEYIGFVECDSAIMEEMFDIIEEAN